MKTQLEKRQAKDRSNDKEGEKATMERDRQQASCSRVKIWGAKKTGVPTAVLP